MNAEDLKPNTIVRGPMFPEPVKVIRVVSMGGSIKLVGQGMTTGLVHQPILSPAQLANLEGSPEQEPFDGDATKFKLGVEALRLGIAYEYDPYFSLSIARVDPLSLGADNSMRRPRLRRGGAAHPLPLACQEGQSFRGSATRPGPESKARGLPNHHQATRGMGESRLP